MKNKFNQEINIDNIEEYLYNNSNIPKFTYEDFLKYQSIFHPEDKLEKNDKFLMVKENEEKYEYKKVNNEHDKVFRTILDDKKEAVTFINKTLELDLKEEELEKYKENYITEELINNQTDIVYKIKDKKVFILIEHQTKIDYSMPYRIMEYQYKITKSAVDINKLKLKEYKIPIVIPIVLYTGRKKWNAKKYIKEAQESFEQYNGEELGKYKLVDVNDYTDEELLKEKTFLSKAMLIESRENTGKIVEYLEKIINTLNKDKEYNQKHKELMTVMLDLTLRRKINNDKITNSLIQKLGNNGGGEMLAILDTIDEENRRILNQGRRQGRQEGRQEERKIVAKRMKEEDMPIDSIIKFTGLSKEEIEKL